MWVTIVRGVLKKWHLSLLVIPWVNHYRDITREFFHDIIRDGIFGNRDSTRDSSVLIIPDIDSVKIPTSIWLLPARFNQLFLL